MNHSSIESILSTLNQRITKLEQKSGAKHFSLAAGGDEETKLAKNIIQRAEALFDFEDMQAEDVLFLDYSQFRPAITEIVNDFKTMINSIDKDIFVSELTKQINSRSVYYQAVVIPVLRSITKQLGLKPVPH